MKFKKLSATAKAPVKGTSGAAGYDLFADSVTLEEGLVVYGTGLSFEIPKGYAGFLLPRSSVSKTNLSLANTVGVIDADYRGEVLLKFRRNPGDYFYETGFRVGQIVFLKLPELELEEADELEETVRGFGSFGSTGGREL